MKCIYAGADPGFDQGGGPQIVTGLKLPFWGLSFVEFWCWGLIFGGQGGPGPRGPPGSTPVYVYMCIYAYICTYMHKTMASVASLEKIAIIRSREFMPSEARLKSLKKMIILGPKTAILGPQFYRILVLGPHFSGHTLC